MLCGSAKPGWTYRLNRGLLLGRLILRYAQNDKVWVLLIHPNILRYVIYLVGEGRLRFRSPRLQSPGRTSGDNQMNRFDRALGILLLLRSGESLSATELARRFEVSTRTIYRDVEALGMVGVPVYAERGRDGGFRLVEGYFLPPVMFTRAEAVSLLLAVTLLRNLRSRPFAADLELAEE